MSGAPVTIGIGDTLRDAREEQGRSIEEAAEHTRIRGDFLRALEEEQFRSFGGDIYAKGFLSTYARYLQLDPSPLLDLYRQHVQQDNFETSAIAPSAPRQPRQPPPRWIAWAVAAAVLILGFIAIANLLGGRAPEPAQGPGTGTGDVVAPGAGTGGGSDGNGGAGGQGSAEPSPQASPTPTADVNLTLLFEQASWVRIQIDGETIEEGTIPPGESRTLEADDSVTVRFGNAGGVRAELNGQDLGAVGARGEVLTVTFTPQGSQPA